MLGKTLAGRYEIIDHLGDGGFGQTFKAKDHKLPGDPLCVVKKLEPEQKDPATLQLARRLFDTEAEILQTLGTHDRIPQLLAHFEENQEFFLVQEFIEGNSLSDEINSKSVWNESQVIEFLQDILTVLKFVHENKVIHRDIKPANLIRRQDKKIVLIDFGAVKEIQKPTQVQGQLSLTVGIGTSGYMPSEQSQGTPKFCSDIYAVGMTAIQALTGLDPSQIPQDPQTGEIIWRRYAQVSSGLATILDKMVLYDFRQRYPSATEALQAVESLISNTKNQVGRRDIIKWIVGSSSAGILGAVVVNSWQNKKIIAAPIPPSEKEPKLATFSFNIITVDARGQEINRSRGEAEYFREDLGRNTILDMVSIPGGTFMMGSPYSEVKRYDSEDPQHQVTVKPFFMGKFTVTQAQWFAVAKLPKIEIDLNSDPSNFKGANRPVEQVNWYEAEEFCARLSKKTGKKYRLPSEAEWEYACRAGTTTPFYFGETITTDLANFDGNSTYAAAPKGVYREATTDLGSFLPNTFGLYDMHGNVYEWCADNWHENYNNAPTDGSVWQGGDDKYRMLRGGSWPANAFACRAACRMNDSPDIRDSISVFGLFVRVGELLNPLFFCPFALYSFSFTL